MINGCVFYIAPERIVLSSHSAVKRSVLREVFLLGGLFAFGVRVHQCLSLKRILQKIQERFFLVACHFIAISKTYDFYASPFCWSDHMMTTQTKGDDHHDR